MHCECVQFICESVLHERSKHSRLMHEHATFDSIVRMHSRVTSRNWALLAQTGTCRTISCYYLQMCDTRCTVGWSAIRYCGALIWSKYVQSACQSKSMHLVMCKLKKCALPPCYHLVALYPCAR